VQAGYARATPPMLPPYNCTTSFFPPAMRIRTRLLILVLSVLIPSFSAALLAVAYVYNEEQASQARGMTEATRAFALLVNNELQKRASNLQALANAPSLARGDLAEFYEHARKVAPTPETTVILADLQGRQLLNTRVALGTPLPARRASNLGELMQRYGSDRVLISDLFLAPLGKRHDFSIQVPVRIGEELRYVLIMGVNASTLQGLFVSQHFPKQWISSVVDRKGVVVARSRDAQQWVGTPMRESSRLRMGANSEGVYQTRSLDGIDVRAFFSTVPDADWKVAVSIPIEEIRRVPLQAAALLAGLMALLLVLGLLAARWFANRAIEPIEYLGRSAEGLGQGEEMAYRPLGVAELDSVGRRMAEASRQIRDSTTQLEQRVAEAVTATERAQRALLQSQKLEALGRLTGGIAHEFNNLLQTLTTALQLAEMTSTQPKVQKLIETCKRTVSRATALTGQLGSFGRVQEGRLATVGMHDQARSAVQLMKGALRHDIAVSLSCEKDAWPVTIEPLQFDLALLNLAINARDAMPGGGMLRIEVCNLSLGQPPDELAAGDYVLVTMTDSGTGMTPEVLARALDPFFTTKTIGHGSGLGLPQAYAFATQSQGTLVLHSCPGEGTRVEIYLPRASRSLVAGLQPDAGLQARGKGTVLFVEDDVLVREAVVPALEDCGFTLLVAGDGEAALKMLEDGARPDVVFSDIVMPGRISGIDLAGLVRQRDPSLPVVLATGYTEQQAALPGVRILAKPYAIEKVVALLTELSA
jgi:signal transduction histidine kinase/CheY-like chemotaxis protein